MPEEIIYNKGQYDLLIECSRKTGKNKWDKWEEYRKNNMHKKVNLKYTDFSGANLNDVYFFNANLTGADLSGASLKGADLYNANLKGASLYNVSLEGADLTEANLNEADLCNISIGEAFNKNEERYIFTNFLSTFFGDAILSIDMRCMSKENDKKLEKDADKELKIINAMSKAEVNNIRFIDPVFGRKVKDEAWLFHFKGSCEGSKFKQFGLWLWKHSSDYGRSIGKWAFWSFFIAFIFSLFYNGFYVADPLNFESGNSINVDHPYISILYYSVVTFTTLGFGDIKPVHLFLQVMVMFEVILGYIMLGGLISIFANKLARRND